MANRITEPRYTPTREEIERECERIRAERSNTRVYHDEPYEYIKPEYRDPGRLWNRKGPH